MSYQARVIEILIASPSDVLEERELITQTILEWNILYSKHEQVVLLPVRWETHANTEYDGYDTQEILNKQFVRDCDILIGAMNSRLGTPTRKAESGTIEEIEEFINLNKPIKLYFSKRGHPSDVDTDELNRLRKFQSDYRTKGIYKDYKDLSELKQKINFDLTAEVRKLKKISEQVESEKKNVGINKGLFLFHANASGYETGKVWHELVDGSYSKKFLASELSKASVKKIMQFQEAGILSEISVLGLYYGDESVTQNAVIIKIKKFSQLSEQVKFSFELIKDTGIPSRLILEMLGQRYAYSYLKIPQLIVNTHEDLLSLLKRCESVLSYYKDGLIKK